MRIHDANGLAGGKFNVLERNADIETAARPHSAASFKISTSKNCSR